MSNPTEQFLLMHLLKVKGFATAEALADALGRDADSVEAGLRDLEGEELVKYRDGRIVGFALTAPGKARHAVLRDEALSPETRSALTTAYDAFLSPNRAFKQLTTDWQTRPEGTETGPLLDRLAVLDAEVEKLLDVATAAEPRLAHYKTRFRAALTRLHDGDATAFARPMSDSYHDVWMELHEDLILSLAYERTDADE